MMVKVIRDYDFNLFKFNRVCGQLRDEKEGAMINMMTRAGKHRPGLVLLDHRLNLGEKGLPHAITYLQPLVGLLKDKPNQKAGKTAPVPLLTDGQRVYFRQ